MIAYARGILALHRDAWAELTRSAFEGSLRVGVSEAFAEARLLRELQDVAVAPMAQSQVGPGLAVLGAEHGLPALPDAEFRLFSAPDADPRMVEVVTQVVLRYGAARRH